MNRMINAVNQSINREVHYYYLLLILITRLARIVETSIHYILFIQILVIDLILTTPKEFGSLTVFRCGISIQYSVASYNTKKSY